MLTRFSHCWPWPPCCRPPRRRKRDPQELAERLPNFPKIDEVTKTRSRLWEVRIGHDLLYTDEQGNHVIQGTLFDTGQGQPDRPAA